MTRKSVKKASNRRPAAHTLKSTRRGKRPPRSGFGQIFDLYLDLMYQKRNQDEAKQGRPQINFTEYLEEIADQSGLTLRQINRIRASIHGPERGTLEKLSEALPGIYSIVKEGTSTQRVSWNIVSLWQSLLPDKSTISILSGFEPPRALDEENSPDKPVTKKLAENLFNRGFVYIFIYPKTSTQITETLNKTGIYKSELKGDFVQQWIDDLRDRAFAQGFQMYRWKGSELAAKHELARKNIHLLRIENNEMSVLLWSMAPRYLALANLFAQPGSEYERTLRTGVFWERGQLPSINVTTLNEDFAGVDVVTGWIFLPIGQYHPFQDMLKKVTLLDEHEKQVSCHTMPKPGESSTAARTSR